MLLTTIFVELCMVARRSRKQAGRRWPCCAMVLRRTAWSVHGMGAASVIQTQLHCVNQMGKTHSKPLVARHAMCESAFNVLPLYLLGVVLNSHINGFNHSL
jgi:hypothetical protein